MGTVSYESGHWNKGFGQERNQRMIERYTNPETGKIWTDQSKYEMWWKVERAAAIAMGELGIIPADAAKEIEEATVEIRPERIEEIEATTRHDVIAFLTHIEEQLGGVSRWIHFGMTSSDVLDTAFALQLKSASERISEALDVLLDTLKKRALEYKNQPMMGRSHGIHAEPVTFGLVLATYYAEFDRHRERFARARKEVETGMISGAVGTFAHIPPEVEVKTCEILGLTPEPISTQVIPRDRHAAYFSCLAGIASSIERLAVQLRHQQRTEVREVEEAFRKGQKGSSAMPHKKNPISAENLTGLARVIRSNAFSAFENVALWHERDISHSSVERVIAPDSTILADYALRRLTRLVGNLAVIPESMQRNLEQMRGLAFSQPFLLMLARKGLKRQTAYEIVQRHAMKVWDNDDLTLKDSLLSDDEVVGKIGKEAIEQVFDLKRNLTHVDAIFERVFGK